jgi:phosphatidylinositol alpha-1,6-mannosyltransferase
MPNRSLDGTDFEGFGIVFVEAALAGRPSIAGRSGGTADAVVDEVTGLVVDTERPGELTGALRRLLGDADLRRRFGRAADARARAQFSTPALAGSLRAQLGWN